MNDPPDVAKKKNYNDVGLQYNFTNKLAINSTGPIYLIINRIESENNFSNVSPFLIKRAIDSTCGGEVSECKKLRNGTLLIKTKNSLQANKLIKLTAMNTNIKIQVSVHKSLNYSKGVIYSPDLFGVPEEEIQLHMASQKVTEVKKILRKENETLKETGLLILTFAAIELPEYIYMGYQKIYLRPYIPPPIRCNNCLHYGHLQKTCENNKICYNCGNPSHINADSNEVCTNSCCCINCKENNIDDWKHSAKDKNCPIFLKNKEIQAIKVLQKTSMRNAEKIYNSRHIKHNSTYSAVANSNTPKIARAKLIW
ncbi:hypothetical protein FF38_12383 [Lucilia cuprina]|uniref:CCHC-type domain-containing protein n=1 Tax=Lucilia cuprina TaxID=7375 RepID=A0A0L0BW63_LUCCU|nr:hypothetical protein FF38_12383 [Lucilia cuprina]